MSKLRHLFSLAALAAAFGAFSQSASAESMVERGKYLATVAGCGDCHTPGYFLGKPDMKSYLGGSDVGFEIPGLGVFVGRNLTPDTETGLGKWSVDQIVAAIQKGVRPDGRQLAPIMPWRDFAAFTKRDAKAIAMYLKTLPAVSHAVPGPFGPNEKAPVFVMKVVPPAP